jgi:pimeloyl-ACP methyl ester carboxylesterase
LLGRRLAAAGHHVLRLDYHGTGDSAGEFEDTQQSHWLDDIDAAIVELKDIAHVSRVALVGVRYGATLAACAAGMRDDVHQLVLWDAIVDGAQYLSEMGAANREFEENIDAAGVVLNSQARADIRSTTLESYGPSLPRTLVAVSAPDPEPYHMLVKHLDGHGVEATLQHAVDICPWLEGRVGVMALPVTTVERVVAWLS